ncbi:MAG: hypothetical protein GXO36_04900 [Chloroflexi bacterium]|nr:hypothetical protein [Chloroflexota bacterium]
MTWPAFFFGTLVAWWLAGLIAWRWAPRPGRLLLYVLLGWAGFWLGHSLALRQGWTWGRLGPLSLAGGIIGTLAVVGFIHFLLTPPPPPDAKPPQRRFARRRTTRR